MDKHNNAIGLEIGQKAETWEDVVRLAREKLSETVAEGNDPKQKNRPYWINDVPEAQWAKNWKSLPIPNLEGGESKPDYSGPEPVLDPLRHDAFGRGMTQGNDQKEKSIKDYLSSEGAPEDEAMLKDDLTEDELKRVMKSNAYNDDKDPRFEAVNKRIAWWFEDRFGADKSRSDATGRLIQPKEPKHPAPARPLASSLARTGVPLTSEIAKIVAALFKPSAAIPARAETQETAEMDPHFRGGGAGEGSSPRVALLQETLNKDDLRHGGSFLDEPLKIDGVAGPKTRRALRHTVARFGADRITAQWADARVPGLPNMR